MCQHLFQALSGLNCVAAFGEQGCTLLLQAALQLELLLCLRFPFQPQRMLPLSFFLFLLFLVRLFYFHCVNFKEVGPLLRSLLTNFLSPELLEQGPKAPVVHLCRR